MFLDHRKRMENDRDIIKTKNQYNPNIRKAYTSFYQSYLHEFPAVFDDLTQFSIPFFERKLFRLVSTCLDHSNDDISIWVRALGGNRLQRSSHIAARVDPNPMIHISLEWSNHEDQLLYRSQQVEHIHRRLKNRIFDFENPFTLKDPRISQKLNMFRYMIYI